MTAEIKIEKAVNVKAQKFALAFGLLHILMYLFFFVVLFFFDKFLDTLINHTDIIAFILYSTYLISLFIVCSFKIVSKEKRAQLTMLYSMFFVFNLMTLSIYLGLRNFTGPFG